MNWESCCRYRRVDFKNAVIIMTSNLGAREITTTGKTLGFAASSAPTDEKSATRERVMAALKDAFRPEFLNRIDEIIVFDKLTDADIRRIADNMISSVIKRIEAIGVNISFDEKAMDYLAKEGTDKVYGARPLRRTIVHKVEDGFATAMLEGRFKKGDIVTVSADGSGLTWNKTEKAD